MPRKTKKSNYPILNEAIEELGGPNKASEETGISKMRFYKWRSGDEEPTLKTMRKLQVCYPKYSLVEYMSEFMCA